MVRTYDLMHATTSNIRLMDEHQSKRDARSRRLRPEARSESVPSFRMTPRSGWTDGEPAQVEGQDDAQTKARFQLVSSSAGAGRRAPIVLPMETARYVEPVFGGNRNVLQGYGEDYDRQYRDHNRQMQQQYLREMQEEAAAQRQRRLENELAFGGYEFEKDLLKYRRSNDDRRPQLARERSGPEPGRRGRLDTALRDAYARELRQQADDERERRQTEEMERQQRMHQQQQSPYYAGYQRYTPTFGGASASESASAVRRGRSVPNDLHLFGAGRQPAGYDPMSLAVLRHEEERQTAVYDPWGKGGGGAPIRDKAGRLVADRRLLRKSWNEMLDTNLPHDASFNKAYEAAAVAPLHRNTLDVYQDDLRRQIDEQRQQKQLEKLRERELDERDRVRIEREMEQQRREAMNEQKQQEERARRAQVRADLAAANTATTATNGARRRAAAAAADPDANTKRPPVVAAANANAKEDDGLEWWERQPETWGRNASSTTTNGNAGRTNSRSTADVQPPPPEADHSRRRTGETAESPAARNQALLRQLSAMRERLGKDQIRVRSALRRGDYEHLFSDDDDYDEDVVDLYNRDGAGGGGRTPKSRLSKSLQQRSMVAHGRRDVAPDDADDSPLIQMIRNSQAFDLNQTDPSDRNNGWAK